MENSLSLQTSHHKELLGMIFMDTWEVIWG